MVIPQNISSAHNDKQQHPTGSGKKEYDLLRRSERGHRVRVTTLPSYLITGPVAENPPNVKTAFRFCEKRTFRSPDLICTNGIEQ